MSEPRLAYFLSYADSVRESAEMGYLSRLKLELDDLAKHWTVELYVRDSERDLADVRHLLESQRIQIYPVPIPWRAAPGQPTPPRWRRRLGSFLGALQYWLVTPWWHRRALRAADVIFVRHVSAGLGALLAARLFNRRAKVIVRYAWPWSTFVTAVRPRWEFRLLRALERSILRRADVVMPATEHLRQEAVVVGRRGSDVVVVPNWIDTRVFFPQSSSEPPFDIIHVGRLSPQKNHRLLFEAVRYYRETYGASLRVCCIGDGPLKGDLEKVAEDLQLNVTFVGRIPNGDMPWWLARSRCFVFPSRYEGHPKALLEAMSCGLPVVATRVRGTVEVLDGTNGLLVEEEPASLADAIHKVLSDEAVAAEIGRKARELVLSHFSFTEVQKEYRALFQRLTAPTSSKSEETALVYEHRAPRAKYLNPNWCYSPVFWSKVRWVEEVLDNLPKPLRVLDVGSGVGLVSERLTAQGYDVVGLDLEPEGEGIPLVKGDTISLPFPDGAFDVVLLLDVLEHLPYGLQEATLREAQRVLAPSPLARILITFPNLSHLSSRAKFLLLGQLERTAELLKHPGDRTLRETSILIHQSGLREVACRGIFPTIPPLYQLIMRRPRAMRGVYSLLNRCFARPSWCLTNAFVCVPANQPFLGPNDLGDQSSESLSTDSLTK